MHDSKIVQGLERLQNLVRFNASDASIILLSRRSASDRPSSNSITRTRTPPLFEDVVHLADVRMIYPGQRPYFAPKPATGSAALVCLVDGFDSDRPLQSPIPPLIDHAHGTLANLLPDPVVTNGFEHGEMIPPAQVTLRGRVVAGGAINRRYLAAHGANIRAQLAAVMDGIEEHEPQQVTQRRLPRQLALDQKPSVALPRHLIQPADPLAQISGVSLERGDDRIRVG